jgi:hypothetical protein
MRRGNQTYDRSSLFTFTFQQELAQRHIPYKYFTVTRSTYEPGATLEGTNGSDGGKMTQQHTLLDGCKGAISTMRRQSQFPNPHSVVSACTGETTFSQRTHKDSVI